MKILITDMDGCLTDGTVYVDEKGKETRRYYTYDSLMFFYWDKIYFMTKEKNKSHYYRYKKLHKKYGKKISFIRAYSKSYSYFNILKSPDDEVDFIGDDFSDMYIIEGRDSSYVPKNSMIDLFLSKTQKDKFGIVLVDYPVIPNILLHKCYLSEKEF